LPQLTNSLSIKPCKASGGGLVCGAKPRKLKRSRTSERDPTVRNASYNLATIAAGVRAGATTIPQPDASKSGTPLFASGGISGAAGSSAAEVTPSARDFAGFDVR